tara:strand:- start:475 stop:759 length:285 start_codon:yes stop_codon:yes gene_type:complete
MSLLTNKDQLHRHAEKLDSCLTHTQDLLLTLTSDRQYLELDREGIGRVLILIADDLSELRSHQKNHNSSVEGLLLDFKETTEDYVRFLTGVTYE